METYSREHHIQYDWALSQLIDQSPNTIIDVGSGRGHMLRMIQDRLSSSKLVSVDLDRFHEVNNVEFVPCNLSNEDDRSNLSQKSYDALVCLDVFEHLDKKFISDVIKMCALISPRAYLSIANHSDVINGIELHTIQESDAWWDQQLHPYFQVISKETHYNGRLYLYNCVSKIFETTNNAL